MLTQTHRELVKGTAALLKEQGVALTRHFYARMFEYNPELKAIFNQGHQREGSQQQALAMAVAAYAQHIDNPGVLMPVLELIANKHVSLGIRAEHYAIVGRHLLASIREVLGALATDELIEAWGAAYGQLADVLVGIENKLYAQAAQVQGGWSGWRNFRVEHKQVESEEITSFYLVPADGGEVPAYQPGQYVSVKLFVPALGYSQPRQYSLSAAPGGQSLRISVKRESGDEEAARPQGMVSNLLHASVKEGDVIEVSPPMGDFVLHQDRDNPVVLISAGVGLTPMVSMLEALTRNAPKREVRFIHACRHGGVHAFREHVANVAAGNPRVKAKVHYEFPREEDQAHPHEVGRIELSRLQDLLPSGEADFYVCGPKPFMQAQMAALKAMQVPAERIHAEVFGTGGV
ncbi:dihydropteridine reductase [Aquabacterium sp. NJ1]|uniref:NO-inducible flavohemoprotein n=1 Tax=Aquabacterium sp. NJ1 TaxID=1538295 RepID=UPI00052DC1C3|nr:NO-inducible flavohemoprotein [Aquabacterium sp. NJ1]KGM41519.1 dihydropteridine reductase [Aquabacterium sp. NJ1]